jgi:hypothetical protein
VLSDLIGDLIGDLLGDELNRRRGRRKASARLAVFNKGSEVTIPCAVRYPVGDHPKWTHGTLTLSRGKASWKGRFSRGPSLTLNRQTAIGVRTRQISGREKLRMSPRLTVLAYDVAGVTVEMAVRRDDLPLAGRVLNIPPG